MEDVIIIDGVGYYQDKKCQYYEAQLEEKLKSFNPGKVKLTGEKEWYCGCLMVKGEVRWPYINRGILTYGWPEPIEIMLSGWEDC